MRSNYRTLLSSTLLVMIAATACTISRIDAYVVQYTATRQTPTGSALLRYTNNAGTLNELRFLTTEFTDSIRATGGDQVRFISTEIEGEITIEIEVFYETKQGGELVFEGQQTCTEASSECTLQYRLPLRWSPFSVKAS